MRYSDPRRKVETDDQIPIECDVVCQACPSVPGTVVPTKEDGGCAMSYGLLLRAETKNHGVLLM
jgi:hypothetical protein